MWEKVERKMKYKKIATILRIPLVLLVLIAFGTSIYAFIVGGYGIKMGTPIIL